MIKKRLSNGLTIIKQSRQSDSITLMVSIKVGSNNEKRHQAGISHFLEHMIFEGTKTRTARQIAETIEKVGGEFNAMTTNERTCFYVKLPAKHTDLGLEILYDIINNSTFETKSFNKEKKVVLEEINMVNDQPLHYQWIFFQEKLFKKNPSKNPVYGNVKAVKAMTPSLMKAYHKKYYIPNNMSIVAVGNQKYLKNKIGTKFKGMKKRPLKKHKVVKEPKQKSSKTFTKNKKNNQSYAIIGYKTVPRTHKDSYALDIIRAILYKGLSGKITEEIRVKRGLAYDAGAHHECMRDFGFFCVYFNTNKPSLNKCKKIALEVVDNIKNTTTKELKEAKTYLEGNKTLRSEDPIKHADDLSFWEFVKDAKETDKYQKRIRKVTLKEIKSVAKRYLSNYTMTVLN